MAFEVADDCPHCPPAALQETAYHGSHDAEATSDCESMQADCCDLQEAAATDNRGGKFESQDHAPGIAGSASWPSLHTASTLWDDLQPPDPGNHSPPLHKLFCVYLD